jgi:APA family basic amino acid/polyamine antiporter
VLGDMTSVGTLAAFAIVCLSVIYLRRSAPELPRGFKVPLYPVLPVLGILSCLYLITTVPWNVLQFFLWYMLGGVVLYFVYGMRNSELARGHAVTADGEMPYYPEDNPDHGTVTRD